VDRVFAMLSLVTDWNGEEPIVPDYNYNQAGGNRVEAEANATAKVYAQVSKVYLNSKTHGWSKFPLITSPLKPGIPNLPSWAMDWDTFGNPHVGFWDKQIYLYKADGTWIQESKVTSQGILLTLGLSIGTISGIGKELPSKYSKNDNLNNEVNEILESWKELLPRGKELDAPYPGGGAWLNAWWRTLSGDCCQAADGNIRRLTDEDVGAFANAVDAGKFDDFRVFLEKPPPQAASSSAANTAEAAHHNLLHKVMIINMFPRRRLFVTSSGYLGFGREDIQVGDGIFVLPGANTPCVLRRVEKKFIFGNEEFNGHQSIGGCYVHGVMDGEGVRGEADLFGIV
jgi:hypothetical protein